MIEELIQQGDKLMPINLTSYLGLQEAKVVPAVVFSSFTLVYQVKGVR